MSCRRKQFRFATQDRNFEKNCFNIHWRDFHRAPSAGFSLLSETNLRIYIEQAGCRFGRFSQNKKLSGSGHSGHTPVRRGVEVLDTRRNQKVTVQNMDRMLLE